MNSFEKLFHLYTVSDKSPSPQRKSAHVYKETKCSKRSKGTGTGTRDINVNMNMLTTAQ